MTLRRCLGALALLLCSPAAPAAAQEAGLVVRGLDFDGNRSIDDYTLAVAIASTNSSWFATFPLVKWIGLGEKRFFDPLEFRRDVLRLTLFYRQSGFMDVQVDTVVRRRDRNVYLRFKIVEGPPVVVTRLVVTGLDSVAGGAGLRQELPLTAGMPFNRFLFQAAADSLISRLRDHGYPGAEVFRTYEVDRVGRTAQLALAVAPGPYSTFGSIVVTGSQRVDTTFVRQLLAAREGNQFEQRDLFESQRKLYQTELFRLATVTIDSSRFQPDSGTVPVLVTVSEGRSHRVRSGVGFGTNDCFRGGAQWTDRNLLGTGRLFDLSARVSKVGVGRPFGFGLEHSICSSLKDDAIGSALANYNVTALVRQPRFFTPDITSTVSLFAERRSEFGIYRRDEIGAGFAVHRETARRRPITLAYRLSFGATEASQANFCAFFNACTPTDRDRLERSRLLGIVSAAVSWPRANYPLDPTRGHLFSLDLAHSSRYTGSAAFQTFTRLTGDAAWYRSLGGGAVLSWHLRGGAIVSPRVALDSAVGNFIPPEQRFYAGGPNDVRGYDLNGLGPVVYVARALAGDSTGDSTLAEVDAGRLRPRFSATGGNTLAVGQVELRVPAPIWSSRFRLAFFVDAGTLYERGRTNVAPVQLRVTPGVGLRISTPLGPARFDVGYNGYDQPPGALYVERLDGTLDLRRTDFVLQRGSRLAYHFSIGQPF